MAAEMWYSQAAIVGLIRGHLARYPAMEPRDVYKLLYQGVLGLEHLARRGEFAARLRAEYEGISANGAEPLVEVIRPDGRLARLNLRPFKDFGGDWALLVDACLRTAEQAWGTSEDLRTAWSAFVAWRQVEPIFPLPDVLAFSAWVEEHDYPAAHHSVRYRDMYQPAYRVVARAFLSNAGIV